ncbi:DUF6747 family protein [Robiginitalea aurantiaca]|uniref:DUF6747 family protein n=1 Tax=Robiginitalea aurantiaca TaxID=3056915 RepID=UPI00336C2218
MKTIYILREIYSEAFRNLGNYLIRHSLKLFAWFSFTLILIVLYAFFFRMLTGFAFV